MQDLLNEDGKFLSLDEFNGKFGLKANYLQYFQIAAAIPSSLKQAVLLTPDCSEFLFSTPDLFYLFEETTLALSKIRCKHYYKLFNECSVSEPTGIKKSTKHFQIVFLIGEAISPRSTRLQKIISLGNFYFRYYTG